VLKGSRQHGCRCRQKSTQNTNKHTFTCQCSTRDYTLGCHVMSRRFVASPSPYRDVSSVTVTRRACKTRINSLKLVTCASTLGRLGARVRTHKHSRYIFLYRLAGAAHARMRAVFERASSAGTVYEPVAVLDANHAPLRQRWSYCFIVSMVAAATASSTPLLLSSWSREHTA
jgi:hypothetical protein